MDLARASCGIGDGGDIIIDDPELSWVLRVRPGYTEDGSPTLVDVRFRPREGAPALPPRKLMCRIDLREVTRVAHALVSSGRYPNEIYYRRLAVNEAGGHHLTHVRAVAQWAEEVGWEGGPVQAVAEFWAVSVRTAFRWLRETRQNGPAPAVVPHRHEHRFSAPTARRG